jgi:hypothetical protein
MISQLLLVFLHTLLAAAAALILALGFVFLVSLGDANARGRSVVSRGFDAFAALVLYLCWFGLLWRFGFSLPLLILACGVAVTLCLIYAASYQTAASRPHLPTPAEPH